MIRLNRELLQQLAGLKQARINRAESSRNFKLSWDQTALVGPDVSAGKRLVEALEVFSPNSRMITAFSGDGQIPLDRLILNESVKGAYIAGAYFYKFQPKTFAKAS